MSVIARYSTRARHVSSLEENMLLPLHRILPVVLLFTVSSPVFADDHDLDRVEDRRILHANVDLPNGLLSIHGQDLPARVSRVILGGATLEVLSFSRTDIVARLPIGLLPATYLLSVAEDLHFAVAVGAPPATTVAVFGTGPITLFTSANYILEATDAATLRLRRTGTQDFLDWSIAFPATCDGGDVGLATMAQAFRFSTNVGDVMTATLCHEGSTAFVTVGLSASSRSEDFRCWRSTSNSITCQKLF